MRKEFGIHPAQASVLYALRHVPKARFSDLLRTTSLTSDVFKFHIRKLVKLGYIRKDELGDYVLTAKGKEYANRLDEQTGREILQPKCSMLLIVRSEKDGIEYLLAHKRNREPFNGFWGLASAPVLRGVSLQESAHGELKKQTGIEASFEVAGSYRVIDKNSQDEVLEDKIFMLMQANVINLPLPHQWHGGESQWVTREQLLSKSPIFSTTKNTLDIAVNKQWFTEEVCHYTSEQY